MALGAEPLMRCDCKTLLDSFTTLSASSNVLFGDLKFFAPGDFQLHLSRQLYHNRGIRAIGGGTVDFAPGVHTAD